MTTQSGESASLSWESREVAALQNGLQESRKRPYFPSLDGLRTLAILPVVWHHATTRPMGGVLDRGPLGVDLFFALSGFLITSLLLHEQRTRGGISLRAFWIRRSLRIFPLYYLVLIAFVVHALVFRDSGPIRDDFLRNVPFYATYTSNWFTSGSFDHPIVFSFAWSLATEEQFYLVWPPVIAFLGRGSSRALPVIVMTALIVLDQSIERRWIVLESALATKMLRSFATPIGLGSLLALASDTKPIRLLLARRWSCPVALVVVILGATLPLSVFETHLAMTALVGACALAPNHYLAPVFNNHVMRHIGVVSYGVYLLNVPVVTLTRRVLGGPSASTFLVFFLGAVVTVLLATITHRVIEKPFLRLKDLVTLGRYGERAGKDRGGDRGFVGDDT